MDVLLGRFPYQTLLAQQAEQQGIAHFPQVLETNRLQLRIFHDVFQLVVKEFQDSCEETRDVHFLLIRPSLWPNKWLLLYVRSYFTASQVRNLTIRLNFLAV